MKCRDKHLGSKQLLKELSHDPADRSCDSHMTRDKDHMTTCSGCDGRGGGEGGRKTRGDENSGFPPSVLGERSGCGFRAPSEQRLPACTRLLLQVLSRRGMVPLVTRCMKIKLAHPTDPIYQYNVVGHL